APIADALRDAASIDESATDQEVVDALALLLPGDHADRDRIAARAATVLGAGEPGPPEETFWGVRRIFEALAQDRPLLLVLDDGVLRRDNGSWIVTIDAAEVDVPPTIHALLSARIDRLRADERVVVERASVIGKQFYRGAVAALSPAAVAGHLDTHLETLRRK